MWSLHLALCALFTAQLGTAKFIVPSTDFGDFNKTYTVGDTINIKWEKGWEWGKPDNFTPTHADLFIMWFEDSESYWKLLQANVNMATGGNFTWTFDVPDDKIAEQSTFRFRFSNHTDPPMFNLSNPKMPSKGFILRQKPSEKKSNNIAAIAGGVLGGLLGLSAILGTILFILRRQRKKREAYEGDGEGKLIEVQQMHEVCAQNVQELPMPPSELPGQKSGRTPELHGSTPTQWH